MSSFDDQRLEDQMRDWLTHRYFDTSHAIVAATVAGDLPELESAVRRLSERIGKGWSDSSAFVTVRGHERRTAV